MLRIRVLFFAAYRDFAGTKELSLEVEPGSTVGTAIQAVRGHGDLWRLPTEPIVAVNREYAAIGSPLNDGDELALLPPVAGG